MQPQAILFIEANLHVTAQKSAGDEECRNQDIDEFNNYTKELADNKSIFYVNVNELFDDEKGNLRADLTYDGVHILAKYDSMITRHEIYRRRKKCRTKEGQHGFAGKQVI